MNEEVILTPSTADPIQALRAGTWSLLGSLLMGPPDAQLLKRLVEVDHGSAGDEIGLAWQRLAEAARVARDESLRREYQDVFIGVGQGEVTPYSCWYLTGMLADRPLIELRDDLKALGIAMREDCSETEDHVGALCETMACVTVDEDVDFDWQKDIFRRHVDSWMERFFEDLAKAPSAQFYRAVAGLGLAFLKLERRFYAMLV
ncbi:MAG TPA: molecular chaperone TorD family protein [Azoarcus sp.]|nr:molecular chaperone TorD family protein [Azoarcus sp.]